MADRIDEVAPSTTRWGRPRHARLPRRDHDGGPAARRAGALPLALGRPLPERPGGGLDVLIGNAGISKISPMADLDVEGRSAMAGTTNAVHTLLEGLPQENTDGIVRTTLAVGARRHCLKIISRRNVAGRCSERIAH